MDSWKAGRARQRGGGLRPVDRSKVLTAEELNRLLEVARTAFPGHFPIMLFLAPTGCRISEAFAVHWRNVNLSDATVLIEASIDAEGRRVPTKTGKSRTVELSSRLAEELRARQPDVFGDESPLFPSRSGGYIDYQNFRSRVFVKLVRKAFGKDRRVTAHHLRHTFASLHLARGTNLLWVQQAGGWESAKMLLDVYGHYMPTETTGFADAITAPNGTHTAPAPRARRRQVQRTAPTTRDQRRRVEPTIRFERTTCSLRVVGSGIGGRLEWGSRGGSFFQTGPHSIGETRARRSRPAQSLS